jgi:2-dehydropantoate 2-reductase
MNRTLLVGAGAVGVTYGHHLARGGVSVDFFVRPKYVAEVAAGLDLWRYGLFGRPQHERFVPHGVVSTVEEVAARRYDQVWLCVASPALRGPWLAELLRACGDATIVLLTPGIEDRALVSAHVPEARIVSGLITLIAWAAPLEGERLPAGASGTSFLLPPLAPIPFSGHGDRAEAAAKALRAGGCPAVVLPGADAVPLRGAIASSALIPLIAALEVSRWSLAGLRRAPHLVGALAAMREAQAIGAHAFGARPPFIGRLLSPWLTRLVIALAPRFSPFPLETYLQKHFTKVGEQTRLMLDTAIRRGRAAALPVEALTTLRAALGPTSDD